MKKVLLFVVLGCLVLPGFAKEGVHPQTSDAGRCEGRVCSVPEEHSPTGAVSVGGIASKPIVRDRGSLKVLTIGNSFSICLLKEMPNVARNLGLKLDLCSMYIGGCSLERHVRNLNAPETKPYKITWNYASSEDGSVPFLPVLEREKNGVYKGNIPTLLSADRWDVVTVQQASSQSWRAKTYEPVGTELLAAVSRLAPQAKVYVQQTWSYTPWDGRLTKWKIDQHEMYGRLESAYDAFAKAHGLEQILMGKAVQLYRAELPVVYGERSNNDVCGTDDFVEKDGAWRHKGDVCHLNPRGNYLQALVWTAKLFGADVTRVTYLPSCLTDSPDAAKLMRDIAMRVAQHPLCPCK